VARAGARLAGLLDGQVQVETGPTEHYYGTPDVAKRLSQHGVMTLWRYGVMVSWCYGVMMSWCYGVMVLWRHSVMVLWCHGVMVL